MRLQVEIRPSRQLALLLMAGHAAALFAVLSALPARADMMLAPVLLFSLGYFLLRDAWLRLAESCVVLEIAPEGIILVRRDGERLPCMLRSGSVVTPWLTVLNLLPQGTRLGRGIILLPGSLEKESYRRLRVWLRWGEGVEGERSTGADRIVQHDISE